MISKLTDIENNLTFKIIEFNLDQESKRRLSNLGIYRHDLFEKQAGNGSGPVVIRNITCNSTPIAIGRNLAEGIVIEVSDSLK